MTRSSTSSSSLAVSVVTMLALSGIGFRLAAAEPVRLHPDNPHYFLWRGKPALLITSGEHYGAVLNLDFDYRKYLETLAKDKLNHTRTFTGGAYVEPQGAFRIARNTLAPAPGRFIAPWARSDQPGYAGGGNKFDLSRWNDAYFQRFRDFVAHANKRGIIVEVNLFCPFYEESQWKLSPFSANNNVNGLGQVARTDVYTLDRHGGLLAVQERMVRKLVSELKAFDNVYYEICNEPYFGGVTLEWQHHIAEVIMDAQKDDKKLISRNVANNAAEVKDLHPAISIFNFHYAAPPNTVAMNWQLGKVIGDNETGFRGAGDAPYRMEGWDFIIAGGGLYNNLDYSFAAGHEDGTFVYPASQPGGGSPALRRQLRILRDFIHDFDFIRMKPDNSAIEGGVPDGLSARALVEPGKAYAIYLRPSLVTQFSARWTGELEVTETDEYTLYTASNDGVRLWINGRQLIDNWTDHSETEDQASIRLEAGKRHEIKLEYFYNGGQATMKLLWSRPGGKKEPVPPSAFWLSKEGGRGLRAEYFQGNAFQRPWRSSTDSQVNFAWGTKLPVAGLPPQPMIAPELDLPAGSYRAEWISPLTGKTVKSETFRHPGGTRSLAAPAFSEDIALRIKRR